MLARLALPVVCFVLIASVVGLQEYFSNIWLSGVGILGAFVANTTGIGSGIVYVPVFHRLGVPTESLVGTSTFIQCFGMAMGAFTYQIGRLKRSSSLDVPSADFYRVMGLVAVPACLASWVALTFDVRPAADIGSVFRWISGALGMLMLASVLIERGNGSTSVSATPVFSAKEAPTLAVIGLIGGLFVAWISIGVGELLAVYLLMRRYSSLDAIGLAVSVSAVNVLWNLMFVGNALPADITLGLCVVPGAMIGGYIARRVVATLGARQMKWFCLTWIFLSVIFA
jgi:uncharacterized membrane protein YfcA